MWAKCAFRALAPMRACLHQLEHCVQAGGSLLKCRMELLCTDLRCGILLYPVGNRQLAKPEQDQRRWEQIQRTGMLLGFGPLPLYSYLRASAGRIRAADHDGYTVASNDTAMAVPATITPCTAF